MDANDILTRYRHLRRLSIKHHHEALRRVTTDTMLECARQVGLAAGRTFLIENENVEWPIIADLTLYTAAPGRSRGLDRHARAALPKADAEEARFLRAMCDARFSVWQVERHHDVSGVIMSDLLRGGEVWLVDEGFASVAKPGWMTAMRIAPVAEFFITCGVIVPTDQEIMETAIQDRLAWVRAGDLPRVVDDPRFAVAMYRTALEQGVAANVRYRDLSDPLPTRGASAA